MPGLFDVIPIWVRCYIRMNKTLFILSTIVNSSFAYLKYHVPLLCLLVYLPIIGVIYLGIINTSQEQLIN